MVAGLMLALFQIMVLKEQGADTFALFFTNSRNTAGNEDLMSCWVRNRKLNMDTLLQICTDKRKTGVFVAEVKEVM